LLWGSYDKMKLPQTSFNMRGNPIDDSGKTLNNIAIAHKKSQELRNNSVLRNIEETIAANLKALNFDMVVYQEEKK